MNHKAFLETLTTSQRQALTRTSNRAGFRHLAGYLVCVAGAAAYVLLQAPFWPVAMMALGILLAFLFTLQHECTHNTPFQSRWLNMLVGQITGIILFQPFLWFRYFHMAHHRHTNIVDKDPELGDVPKPNSWPALSLHLSTITYWRDKFMVLISNGITGQQAEYVPKSKHIMVRGEALFMLAIYGVVSAAIVNGHYWLLSIWIMPLILGFPLLRLYLLAEHGRCPHVADMFFNTRTIYTNRLVCFLTWNMPFHTEHHILPAVPFYKLPAFNKYTQQHLAVTNNGYGEFTSSYIDGFHKDAT